MAWSETEFISAFLVPPLNFLLLGVIGLLCIRSRPSLAKFLISLSLVSQYLFSAPWFTLNLLKLIEPPPLTKLESSNRAQAIVVLGAGTYLRAPDYGGDTVNRLGLEHVRYAARLYRATQKPILVSGGKPQGSQLSEAAQMTAVLVDDFKVPVKWEEAISNTTYENAKFSHEILKSAGINRIYLVTHAWHMRRAVFAFESAGFSVIPAPTGFASMPLDPLERYLPSAQGLFASCIFMHEVLGWLWYQIKARI
jgi:uncharacterized SAM-binding protein YcdF (DUF218 family)